MILKATKTNLNGTSFNNIFRLVFPLAFTQKYTHTKLVKKGNKQITPRKFIPKLFFVGGCRKLLLTTRGDCVHFQDNEGLLNIIFITNGEGVCVCV